jgi:putative DNA modification/repair radical SAM protein
MSVNIELPTERSLEALAPQKTKNAILAPMRFISSRINEGKKARRLRSQKNLSLSVPRFVPAGQTTQLIIGATPETDLNILRLSEGLYGKLGLKRVYYSAYMAVNEGRSLPALVTAPPLLREHRLYQADWLLRFYNFTSNELFVREDENLSLNMDPKCHWALNHLEHFPVEVNRADYMTLLRVPGIGQTSANRIVTARRMGKLGFDHLKKMGIVLKRAKYFITCDGRMFEKTPMVPEVLEMRLTENKINEQYAQLGLFDNGGLLALSDNTDEAKKFRETISADPKLLSAIDAANVSTREDFAKCVTGEM